MVPPLPPQGRECSTTAALLLSPSTAAQQKSLPLQLTPDEREDALQLFAEFLQFQTVSGTARESGEYERCAKFIVRQLEQVDVLEVSYLEEAPADSPVVVACWKAPDHPDWPVLLLNSHYDVVPAAAEDWTVPPFEGVRRDGKIYGRGSQDMKIVGLQVRFPCCPTELCTVAAFSLAQSPPPAHYSTSTRCDKFASSTPTGSPGARSISRSFPTKVRAKHSSSILSCFVRLYSTVPVILTYSIHSSFSPCFSEVGGGGMACFLESQLFKSLPGISLALDEGLASVTPEFDVFYGERVPW